MKLNLKDFLPKEIELETEKGIIKIKEPTIENLIEIQRITKDMEEGKIDEINGIVKILSTLSDNPEQLEEVIRKIPYSKLVDFQKQVFAELGLAQNQVNDEK